jgi:myo-inositol 2-dehydrogenase / D-chiro-inositol 1-dehydrogenase
MTTAPPSDVTASSSLGPDQDAFRLAVVGAGRMGQVHIKALTHSNVVRIAAVVEPRPEVRTVMQTAGLRCFASLAELTGGQQDLGKTSPIDGVLISVPTASHLDLVRQALTAGWPVLCEKPCGLSVTETRACADAAAASSHLLQVAYWRRYVPELQALRAGIASGEFGEILAVHCYQWDQAPPPSGFLNRSGGIFVDMGVHEFDQIRWLTNQEIVRSATVLSRLPGRGQGHDPDCGQLVGELSGGGTVVISLGRWHPAGDMCWVEVYGTAATARLFFLEPENGDEVLAQALRLQVEDFAAAVRTGIRSGASVDDALVALQLATEAMAQAQQRSV